MSDTYSTRTVCCKLVVDECADRVLRQTQAAFNAAASYCAQVAWEQRITNKNTLHHIVYYQTRTRFGLGAQLACCARDKAAEAVRAVRDQPERKDKGTGAVVPQTCPSFRDDGSIRYDKNTYRLMDREQVSLNTLAGRIVGQLDLGDFQRRYLYDLSWSIGGAELIRRKHVWYLCITQSKRAAEPDEPLGIIGIDMGIVNLATTDDGERYSGAQVEQIREKRALRRKRLQTVGTRNARRRLRYLSGKQHRFQKDVNHCISKALVQKAVASRKALALENLQGIRQRATFGREQRARLGNWGFFQLGRFIQYKARVAGVQVVFVDPRNTSRTCHACGYCDKQNRASQSRFCCLQCGHVAVADVNAARNIRERAAVNQPMASSLRA